MDGFVIDAFAFCRLKEGRQGELPVAELSRLSAETADASGVLQWSLQGGADHYGHPQLTLKVAGQLRLKCQRCLQALEQHIDSTSVLVLAQDDASADEIEDLLADDEVEVIVGSTSFDLLQVIEDEALLALPVSPKHGVCPDQTVLEKLSDAKKESPFSVLKNLKK